MNIAVDAYHIKPQNFPWPPVHFAIALIAGFILRQIAPLAMSGSFASEVVGATLVAFAIFVEVWAAFTMRGGDTAILPNRPARHLITRGPFRFTRNPIYLGYILTLVGCGLVTSDAWFFIAAIVTVMVMTMISIRREEMHLLARFGAEFERYCRRTPRWL